MLVGVVCYLSYNTAFYDYSKNTFFKNLFKNALYTCFINIILIKIESFNLDIVGDSL